LNVVLDLTSVLICIEIIMIYKNKADNNIVIKIKMEIVNMIIIKILDLLSVRL